MPRLAPSLLLADPGRPGAAALLERASWRAAAATTHRGVVEIHRLELGG
jgi:hypothetical protein